MNEEHTMMLSKALEPFGASVTEQGLFAKGNREIPSVQISIVKNRLCFTNRMTGDLIMSGPVSARTIQNFVKKFFYWEKK